MRRGLAAVGRQLQPTGSLLRIDVDARARIRDGLVTVHAWSFASTTSFSWPEDYARRADRIVAFFTIA